MQTPPPHPRSHPPPPAESLRRKWQRIVIFAAGLRAADAIHHQCLGFGSFPFFLLLSEALREMKMVF